MNKKIGIMGGTFNPIHYGHLMLAETAYNNFSLDKVLFMPTKKPAYKSIFNIVKDEHRINMVKLAIESNEHFEISTMEFDREGNTYTVDTLNILKNMYPNIDFYFILGADSLYDFHKWYKPDEIIKLATILAAKRPLSDNQDFDNEIKLLRRTYPGSDIRFLDSPSIDISSSIIRHRITSQKSIRYLVPEAVEAYIMQNNLYEDI